MKKILFLSALIVSFLGLNKQALADHCVGADMSFECVGKDSFQVSLSFYRDCAGIAAPSGSVTINVSSTSGGYNFTADLAEIGTGEDITPICLADFQQDKCNAGSTAKYPGIQQYVYSSIVVLPKELKDWVFSWSTCCRNGGVLTNIINAYSSSIYIEAHLDDKTAPCDHSPQFSNLPVPFFCIGVASNYNHGAYDLDGDSLVYTEITPMQSSTTTITYVTGFSATYPLTTTPANTFNFSTSTGQMTFTPAAQEVTVVAVRVDEYRKGVKIGSVMRDIEMFAQTCSNNPPVTAGVSTISGGYVSTGNSFVINTCPNANLNFSIIGSDPDSGQNLYAISNVSSTIPAMSYFTNGDRPDTSYFSWTPTFSDTGSHFFTLTLQDDACPIYSTQVYSFTINVLTGLKVGPNLSICPGAPAQLTAKGSGSYLWTPNSNLSNDTISNPIATPQVTTMYIVTGNLTGSCKNVDTVIVTVDTSYKIHAGPDVKFCSGGSVQLNVTGGGSNFVWTPSTGLSNSTISNPVANPASTTTYDISALGSNGCLGHDTIVVTVNPLPTPNAGANQSVCPGISAPLSATPVNYVSYVWTPNTGLSSSTISNPVATPTATTTYTVTVTDTNGCTGSSNVTVNVYPNIPPTTVTTAAYCQNGSAVLDGGTGTAWSWSPAAGLSATNIQNPLASPAVTTTYHVTITDANGCISTDSVVVTVYPPLVPGVSNDTTINKYDHAYLHGYGGATYSWTPIGGLNNPNISNPIATPLVTTMYYVTITDANGCVAKDSILVTVIDGCGGIVMPNAFTPNGDGKNDVIYPIKVGLFDQLGYLRIYDRWGELVFESSNDFTKGWDGTFNGAKEPIGTYVYVLQDVCSINTTIIRGNITLLR